MKIAVTGATGFIGRHVLIELKKRSIESIAVVRPSSDKVLVDTTSNIVQLDFKNSSNNVFELLGFPDAVIHLAWAGLPNYNSMHHFEVELPAQYKFLKSLIEGGLKTLVVTGTCFEYGMQSGSLSEDIKVNPTNPYGFAKDSLRQQLEYLKTAHPYNLAWARLFYLFGEGQSETSLFSQIRKAVDAGNPIFNMSGGEQLRDYLSVSEAANHLVSLSLLEKEVGIVNVCSGSPISVRKLVEGWISCNGWSIRPNLGQYEYPEYESMAFWGDSQKLYSLIGEKI